MFRFLFLRCAIIPSVTVVSVLCSYDLFIDGREVPAVSGSYFEASHLSLDHMPFVFHRQALPVARTYSFTGGKSLGSLRRHACC